MKNFDSKEKKNSSTHRDAWFLKEDFYPFIHSIKAQRLLLTLDEGYLLMAAPPDLELHIQTVYRALYNTSQSEQCSLFFIFIYIDTLEQDNLM